MRQKNPQFIPFGPSTIIVTILDEFDFNSQKKNNNQEQNAHRIDKEKKIDLR